MEASMLVSNDFRHMNYKCERTHGSLDVRIKNFDVIVKEVCDLL